MTQNQQQQKFGIRESTNFGYALVNAYATAVTPLMRKGFGKEALGFPGLFAFLLMVGIAGFNHSESMLNYLYLWIAFLIGQRIYTFRLLRRGAALHSRYAGWPELAMKFARGSVKTAVYVIEPLLCAGASWVFYDLGERVLGGFFIGAAISLILRETIQAQIDEQRLTVLRDAQIEQQWLQNEFRNRY